MDAHTLRFASHACLPNEFRVVRNADRSLEVHALVQLTEAARPIAVSIDVTRLTRRRDDVHLKQISEDAWALPFETYHPALPPLAFVLTHVPEGTFT